VEPSQLKKYAANLENATQTCLLDMIAMDGLDLVKLQFADCIANVLL